MISQEPCRADLLIRMRQGLEHLQFAQRLRWACDLFGRLAGGLKGCMRKGWKEMRAVTVTQKKKMADDECCDVGTDSVKQCWPSYSACVSWSLAES